MHTKHLHSFGRWLFVVPFFIFGVMHLMQAPAFAPLVPAFFPGPGTFWVYVTGAIFVAVSIGIAFHKYEKEAAKLLGIQLLIFALTIWLPQVLGGNMLSMGNLLKDLALAGAAFAFAGLAMKESMHGDKKCVCPPGVCKDCNTCENCNPRHDHSH